MSQSLREINQNNQFALWTKQIKSISSNKAPDSEYSDFLICFAGQLLFLFEFIHGKKMLRCCYLLH